MSVTDAPTRTDLRCPKCAAPVSAEQDWCLECGTEIALGLAHPPRRRRRWSTLLGSLLLLAASAALVVLVVGPDLRSASRTSGGSQASTTPQATTPARLPKPKSPPWPAGEEGYTVVLLSTTDLAAADARAGGLLKRGEDVGVLRSDEYLGFPPGNWIVWRGRYKRLFKAQEALGIVRRRGDSGEIKFVRARSGSPASSAPPAQPPPTTAD